MRYCTDMGLPACGDLGVILPTQILWDQVICTFEGRGVPPGTFGWEQDVFH